MGSIPQNRLILYILLLGFIPLFFVFSHLNSQKKLQSKLNEHLSSLLQDVTAQQNRELYNHITKKTFQGKDQFYLNKELESLQVLEGESEELKKILKTSFHPDEEAIRRRLHFLSSGQNAISFSEGGEKRFSFCQETTSTLAHPVEVNVSDIKKILSRIEGVEIGGEKPKDSRPHLIVSEFRLHKKEGFLHETFVLNLQVIRREYGK
jgi:hypothetical protein